MGISFSCIDEEIPFRNGVRYGNQFAVIEEPFVIHHIAGHDERVVIVMKNQIVISIDINGHNGVEFQARIFFNGVKPHFKVAGKAASDYGNFR